jgi:hypothetical protein
MYSNPPTGGNYRTNIYYLKNESGMYSNPPAAETTEPFSNIYWRHKSKENLKFSGNEN